MPCLQRQLIAQDFEDLFDVLRFCHGWFLSLLFMVYGLAERGGKLVVHHFCHS